MHGWLVAVLNLLGMGAGPVVEDTGGAVCGTATVTARVGGTVGVAARVGGTVSVEPGS